MKERRFKLGLVGNPNSGKTSIFNLLTGLRQKVGNYPGVTVDSKVGTVRNADGSLIELIDFPGAYSLHANTHDEFVLTRSLMLETDAHHPDAILYVADILMLDKQLLLLTQILDLGFPVLVCLSNCDQSNDEQIEKWTRLINDKLNCAVIPVSSKTGMNFDQLRERIQPLLNKTGIATRAPQYTVPPDELDREFDPGKFINAYHYLLWKHYGSRVDSSRLPTYFGKEYSLRLQVEETMYRYGKIEEWVHSVKVARDPDQKRVTQTLDRYLTQPLLGTVIFILIMFFMFQAIFSWASYPMDWIEGGFAHGQSWLAEVLPDGWVSELITNGLLPGLSGVLVFIPQIAILFLIIAWMDELGYMARVVYLFDHLLQRFGLNGRSVIGLISGGACAIPAIMSTRTINNQRDRLVTMFVIPLIPCSARIPVYAALIGFIVPQREILGVFNSQGLAFMALYSLGIVMALITAVLIHVFVRSDEISLLALQLPDYRMPQLRPVLMVVYEKVKTFVVEAGKIILLISMILWFMASFSWQGEFTRVEQEVRMEASREGLNEAQTANLLDARKLEHSFAG
ncbi:MAG TPA: ferrous iron transport protein B, partial [Saprospiraceae bacterium]|nr:ferrous iron transport protein B [Saprospiraceae bacterium]